MDSASLVYAAIQMAAALSFSPLVSGIIRKVKAWSQHRRGASILQVYYDLYKLFHKETVESATVSWIYRLAPYIYFASTLCAVLLVPFIFVPSVGLHMGDALMMVYLLALGRLFLTLAALDSGSTFCGMGSSRELMISAIVEPALMLCVLALAFPAGSTEWASVVQASLANPVVVLAPFRILAFSACLLILLAETCRLPVDDPSTHLELTMVHEAMILEYSGRQLAFMEWASALKQLLFMGILASVFIPFGVATRPDAAGVALALVTFAGKLVAVAVLVAAVEVGSVKLGLFRVPRLGMSAFALALAAFITQFASWR